MVNTLFKFGESAFQQQNEAFENRINVAIRGVIAGMWEWEYYVDEVT